MLCLGNYIGYFVSPGRAGRRLRHPKRFMAIPSPIIAVEWWRVSTTYTCILLHCCCTTYLIIDTTLTKWVQLEEGYITNFTLQICLDEAQMVECTTTKVSRNS